MNITKDLMSATNVIERDMHHKLIIKDPESGGMIKSQSVESHLLLEILKELRTLNNRIDQLERTAHGIRVNTGL